MGLEACVTDGEGREVGETEAEGCCAVSGKAASAMVISKQHFHTMCLIFARCSVAYGNETIAADLGRYRFCPSGFSGN